MIKANRVCHDEALAAGLVTSEAELEKYMHNASRSQSACTHTAW